MATNRNATKQMTKQAASKTVTKAAIKTSTKAPAKAVKTATKPTPRRPATHAPAAKKVAPATRKTAPRSPAKTECTTTAPVATPPENSPASASPATVLHPVRGSRPSRENSAQSRVIAMMSTPAGATLDAIMSATGWQAHTVRGFVSGAVRKKLGLHIESSRIDGKRTYRVASEVAA
jgi:hypothetical protein